MKIECWTLAVVGTGTGQEPWAEIHPTAASALAAVARLFEHWLRGLTDVQLTDQAEVTNALDGIATFTIEPAIIDTDQLGEK